MKKIVWIGKYQENITGLDIVGSITLYGTPQKNQFVFNKKISISFSDFVKEKIEYFKKMYSDINFYFYDPSFAYELSALINDNDNYICLNSIDILNYLNNKAITREWFRCKIKTPETIVLSNHEVTYKNLKKYFWGYDEFVVQKMISSGGEGTFLFTENSQPLLTEDLYLISPYYKNSISINVTILLTKDNIVIFHPSVQYIKLENSKLLYMGSDFISIKSLPTNALSFLFVAAKQIGENLQFMNYTGICGIDFLFYNDTLYFLEINPRFQGSSFVIDKALQKKKLSLYKLNYDAFYGIIDSKLIQEIESITMNLSYHFDGNERKVLTHPLKPISIEYNSIDYYDYFAERYHIMVEDWSQSIKTQGKILSNLFNKYAKRDIKKVLDCTCGIGTQAISLAYEGFAVTGSDISRNELTVAQKEADKRKLNIKFIYADCRYLRNSISEKFDAIVSIDSALPHLLTKVNFVLAFNSIYDALCDGGIFISSYRNYEELLKTKPNMAYPIRFRKNRDINYTIFRKWEWKKNIIFSKQYVIEESLSNTKLYVNDYKQWAITKNELLDITKETNFSEIYWLMPEESGFSQPLLCLVK